MSELADWLRAQMKERGYNQAQTSVHAGVAGGTISDILTKDHISRIEILFRLADHFGTDRIDILQLTGHIQRAEDLPRGRPQPDHPDYLIQELNEAFNNIPDNWKEDVLAQVKTFVRLANRPPVRIIGDESEDPLEPPNPDEDR